MFLTTAASAGSSIAVISRVLTSASTSSANIAASTNNPRKQPTSTSSTTSITTSQPNSSREEQQSQQSSSTSTNIKTKEESKKRRRLQLPRTNTSSSTATTSTTSSANSASTEATESSILSTPASSINSSPAEASPPAIADSTKNIQYFPGQAPIDAATGSAIAGTEGNQTVTSDSHNNTIQEDSASSVNPATIVTTSTSTLKQYRNSMRRRATETISSANLIPSSLRAVFRDNTAAAAATSGEDNNTTTTPAPTIPGQSLNPNPSTTPSQPGPSTSMTRNTAPSQPATSDQTTSKATNGNATEMPSIKFIPHQDQRTARPSLAFAPMTRTLPDESSIIRVGRYSEREVSPNANHTPSAAPIGFKSKVVSRRHCEFWCDGGQWYVKDVKSSSGTFLNHIRLSQPSTESKPFPINDGDIIQLGMDFRGGEESIFRCVKIRIEVNRGWQKKLNDFNTTTHKALRALSKETGPTSSTECCICLMSIAPCQALFVAPCSHVWHYKCIRPVINNPKMYPQFLCPNCRAVADLDADIEENVDGWDEAEDLPDASGVPGEPTTNRVSTPINEHRTGDDSGLANATDESAVIVQQPISNPTPEASQPTQMDTDSNANPGNAAEDTTAILFSETSPIEIRDPRVAPESLEGVVTPRNEAGPFVFDGTGRRVQAPQPA